MSSRLTRADEGKEVVTPTGAVVGRIECTEDGDVYVRPRRELVANYGSLLTGCWDRDGRLRLDESAVTAVDEEVVRIEA